MVVQLDILKKETYHESKENTEEKAFINNWLKPPVTFVYWPVQTTPQSQVFLIYEPFILYYLFLISSSFGGLGVVVRKYGLSRVSSFIYLVSTFDLSTLASLN